MLKTDSIQMYLLHLWKDTFRWPYSSNDQKFFQLTNNCNLIMANATQERRVKCGRKRRTTGIGNDLHFLRTNPIAIISSHWYHICTVTFFVAVFLRTSAMVFQVHWKFSPALQFLFIGIWCHLPDTLPINTFSIRFSLYTQLRLKKQ
jgi:hypothetical protein